MISYMLNISDIKNDIFIPKYYDPDLYKELHDLSATHDLLNIGELIEKGILIAQTGHEIGKMAYGTGNIPFVRTSDITNWEIKAIPKQGISEDIYSQYAEKEDVQPGDILLVKDGTYLIGTNCMVAEMDIPMVYQSHILKFRIVDKDYLDPYLFFLSLNSSLVQRQIRNMQFTVDIIDTIGRRFQELVLPIPKNPSLKISLSERMRAATETRIRYKAAIKQMPLLIEKVIDQNSTTPFEEFFSKSITSIIEELVQDTTTLEFGSFSAYTMSSGKIYNDIFLPKYYDPEITSTLSDLSSSCTMKSVAELIEEGIISLSTGDEIGKMAYGTGDIPFVRTSDFSNWEIKADTKQGVSQEIYDQYAGKEDVQSGDILIVRDGTYLVGTSCIITEQDTKMLYCGGLIKLRVLNNSLLDEYLLLGLLNSYIVKRQIRTKQFTRDVIDTLGQRLKEVIIPIPNDATIKDAISTRVSSIVHNRITAREEITSLSCEIISTDI